MRRLGLGLGLAACALAGTLTAVVLAHPLPASIFTTSSGATTTAATTTAATTTAATTTSTVPTTTVGPALIAERVLVGGVNVGGLTAREARAALREAFAAPLALRFKRYSLRPRPAWLGASANVNAAVARAARAAPGTRIRLVVRVRVVRVRAYVDKVAERFDRTPVDARLTLRGLRPFIVKGRPGLEIDRATATTAILERLRANLRTPIRLRAKIVVPTVTRKSFGPIIVIRRASNRLDLYHGMRFREAFAVATGQSRYPTPLGRFSIVVKWRHPWWYPPNSDWAKGEKPIPPGPGNPLGTRWMGLSAPGVGIHGTPDAGSIGYSVSHGCIRMRIPDAERLFNIVQIGTPVFIVAA